MGAQIAADATYIEVTDTWLSTLSHFTVTGWWQASSFAAWRGMWSLGLTGANDRIFGALETGTGRAQVAAFEGGLSKYRTTYPNGFIPPLNEWVHYASTVNIGATHDTFDACTYLNGSWQDQTQTNDAASTGTWAMSASSTFRVGQDHDGDNARFIAAYVRVFDKVLTVQEIKASMRSPFCPPQLVASCLLDFPFEDSFRNIGRIRATAVATGSILQGATPSLARPRVQPTWDLLPPPTVGLSAPFPPAGRSFRHMMVR